MDETQTFLGSRSSVDSLPIYKYLFWETILDKREFYPEGEDIGMRHLRKKLSEEIHRFYSEEGNSLSLSSCVTSGLH